MYGDNPWITKLHYSFQDKDYLYLIVLAFLKILAASSLTIDMSFLAALLLFLVALVSTLMSFDMFRSVRNAAGRVLRPERVARPLGGMSLWSTVWIVFIGVLLFVLLLVTYVPAVPLSLVRLFYG